MNEMHARIRELESVMEALNDSPKINIKKKKKR